MLITSPAALRHVIHWLTLVSEGLEADVLLAVTVSRRVSHKSIDHNSDKPSAEWPQHLCISMNTLCCCVGLECEMCHAVMFIKVHFPLVFSSYTHKTHF